MGTYGILRFCLPLFPLASEHFTTPIMVLAVVGIVYGALVAMVQTDIKKLVAYSSVSHLGFVVLGIFAMNEQGLQGGILQMVNHGLSTGALFLIVGMIYERRHTREIDAFGGLAKVVPAFSAVFLITTLSSIGLPGLNGFVGEFLILLGAFQANRLLGAIAASGVVLAAVYMLWMYQRVVWGDVKHDANRALKDLSPREWAVVLPLVALMVWIGVYSKPVLDRTEVSARSLITTVQSRQMRAVGKAFANAGPASTGRVDR
jgi:NADH-quinone oxidoreductase subunit M